MGRKMLVRFERFLKFEKFLKFKRFNEFKRLGVSVCRSESLKRFDGLMV